MWPFRKKVSPRRAEVRKTIRAGGESRWQQFRQVGGVGSALIALLFAAGAVVMDVWPVAPFPYRIGQYVPRDIHARVSFRLPSPKLLEDAERAVRNTTPATFTLNAALVEQVASEVRKLPARLSPPASQPASAPAGTQPATQPVASQPAPPAELVRQFALTEEDIAAWSAFASPTLRGPFDAAVQQFAQGLSQALLVTASDLSGQRVWRQPREIRLVPGAGAPVRTVSPAALIGLDDDEKVAEALRNAVSVFDPSLRRNVLAYLTGTIQKDLPLYQYDAPATAREIDRAIEALRADPPQATYEAGQLIARASRQEGPQGETVEGLEPGELERLQAEHRAYVEQELRSRPWRLWRHVAGRAVIVVLLAALLAFYVGHYQARIVRNHWRGFAVAAVLLTMLAAAKAMAPIFGTPYAAVLPVLMAAIVFAIAYDQRFALAVTVMLAALTVLQLRGDLWMLLTLGAAVAGGVFPLREIRTRTKLVEVSAIAAGGVFVVVWTSALSANIPLRFALIDSAWGAGFALLAGFLVQGVLPVIERMFDIATSMTLLEWCDASKPLLRRLAMEAPGTYNHSLQLGSMCEAAADAIGARGLRARVGAYYHDIGKSHKPAYFVENQLDSPSKHSKLSPAMSLLIITGHVKDGLELAREYNLPRTLWEFISTHHGTTLVQYFYHAAAVQRKADSERAPDEVEFRYPGPKPHSKEAAILMLADASGSSVRSMTEPTPGRIENQVHAMVSRRLMDGQLDECELTLAEVHRIEASLVKSLCSMYHGRIAYPTPAGQRPSAAERDRERAQARANGKPAPTEEKPRPEPMDSSDA